MRGGHGGFDLRRRRARALVVSAVVAIVASLVNIVPPIVGDIEHASAAAGDVSTIAGGIVPGPTLATAVSIGAYSITRSGNNLYVSDGGACVVRRIDLTTSMQQVFAGAGGCGYSGDGGPALAATLTLVNGMAVGPGGDVYLALNDGRVRRVTVATGIIDTVAGTGTWGYTGDGGPATSAQLNRPHGLAVDGAGNIYIADLGNNVVRRVDASTGNISTFAGGGSSTGEGVAATSAALSGPADVELTPSGNLAVAEGVGHIVRVVSIPGGVITSIAGNRVQAYSGDGGPALSASINGPYSLSYNTSGDLLIADYASPSSVIRKVNGSDQQISTVAGIGSAGFSGDNGPATAAQLRSPSGVVTAGDSFYIADSFNYRVRAVVGGTITTLGGNGQLSRSGIPGQATGAQVNPGFVVADAAGNTYFTNDTLILKVAAGTGVLSVYAGGGSGVGEGIPATDAAIEPLSLALDAAGNLFFAETYAHRIRRIDAVTKTVSTFAGTGSFGFSGDNGPALAAQFDRPLGLSFDASGYLYVADSRNHRVRKIAPTGSNIVTTVAGGTFNGPGDGGPALAAQLSFPSDTVLDGAGNLYFTDGTNENDGHIRRVDGVTQIITTVAGMGVNPDGDGLLAKDAKLRFPGELAIDSGGGLLVAETGRNRVRRIDAAGYINTIVGDSRSTGPRGDGGTARAAWFGGVFSITFDKDGNLLIVDGNRLVRKVTSPIPVGGGGFHPINPFRVLDSRTSTGGWNGKLAAGAPRSLTVTGVAGVPSTASSVILNVTATDGSSGSFLKTWPNGAVVPIASNLNFGPGESRPNLVTVRVGAGGKVMFSNAVGSVHVVADLVGWFDDGTPGGDLFNGVTPARILDSRGGVPNGWTGKLGEGDANVRTLNVRSVGGVSATATAVVLNVTVTNGTLGSFLQAWPTGSPRPNSSNLNFAAGQTIPNLVTVKVGTGGQVSFFNALGATHVVADVVGYFDATGLRFHPLPTPGRVLDSRIALGVPANWSPGMSRAFNVASAAGFVGAPAMVMNTTVTQGTQGSFVSVYPQGPLTNSSNLNFAPNETAANLVMVKLAANGYVELYNELGTVEIIGDVTGYFAPS